MADREAAAGASTGVQEGPMMSSKTFKYLENQEHLYSRIQRRLLESTRQIGEEIWVAGRSAAYLRRDLQN